MATSRLLFVVPVLCLENTFSPCPGRWAGRGLQKIEDIPPYCTRTLYTGPPGRGRRGSWHILGSLFPSGRGGEGDITRERGTSGRPLWSWFLVSVLLGPRSLPGPTSSPSPCSATSPYLARPPASILASDGPPLGSWALCIPLPAWRSPGEVMASQRLPGSPVTSAHAGEGVRVAEAAV